MEEKGTVKSHPRSTYTQTKVQVGDLVLMKNQGAGAPWLPGVMEAMISPEHCVVELVDGRTI